MAVATLRLQALARSVDTATLAKEMGRAGGEAVEVMGMMPEMTKLADGQSAA